MDLKPMRFRKRHEGKHIGFASVHQRSQFGELRPQLVGDLAPLSRGCFGAFLGKHGVDQRQHDLSLSLAGMCRGVADEMHTAE